jgi:hypothetical protein
MVRMHSWFFACSWAGLERKDRIGMVGNTKLRNETVSNKDIQIGAKK